MREYLDNGAKLGWLLDPIEKRVYIYRQGEDVECLEEPQSIDGENVLAGLVLDLHEIV
jgi:Uma2 family endonuclease